MAKMYPNKTLRGTTPLSEIRVFEVIRDMLGEEFIAFHDIKIIFEDERWRNLLDGQADFLLADDKGRILVIEVKGGEEIRFNPDSNIWTSKDHYEKVHEIKDPYLQSEKNQWHIKNELDELLPRYRIGYCVIFPEARIRDEDPVIATESRRKLTIDGEAFKNFPEALRRVFTSVFGAHSNRNEGAEIKKVLRQKFAPELSYGTTISIGIHRNEERMFELTKSQYKVLNHLRHCRKAKIYGPAGTGKTCLAIEKARRIQKETGEDVLLMCFNSRLRKDIIKQLRGEPQIKVHTYHSIVRHMLEEAGIDVPRSTDRRELERIYNEDYPSLLLDALEQPSGTRFAGIIVDEGQDFKPMWWIGLDGLLADKEKGIYYIFYDDNQNIYTDRIELPPNLGEPIPLEENCRNTVRIHDATMKYYEGECQPNAIGEEGKSPRKLSIPSHSRLENVVKEEIERLIEEQDLQPEQITILTPKKEGNSTWRRGLRLGKYKVTWDESPEKNEIACATIHSFKGLESPVVILTELDSAHHDHETQINYVGYSRATTYLVIVD